MTRYPSNPYMRRMAEAELAANMAYAGVHMNRKQKRELASTIAAWVPHWQWIYDRYENLNVAETLRIAAWTYANCGIREIGLR